MLVKGYVSLLTDEQIPQHCNREVHQLRREHTITKTAIVTGASQSMRDGTSAEASCMLESLRAVYQTLDPDERQQVKSFISDLLE